MKFCRTLLSILLLALIVLSCVPISVMASSPDPGNAAGTNTKKVVSVLWDNSGSMNNSDKRLPYARYSIQTLMALLNGEDELYITPMNPVDQTTYTIDLANPNRNQVVATELAKEYLKSPSGQTPYESVQVAIDKLIERGMKTSDKMADDNTEYWLFVITDGDFNHPKQSSSAPTTLMTPTETETEFAKFINNYNNFHMVYLGMCKVNLSNPQNPTLKNAGNFTGYYSQDANSVVKTMQSVANQISGRYTLDPSMYTVSGKTVTVHLDRLGFSIRNISAMLQNCNAELVTAKHNGNNLTIKQATVIKADSSIQSGTNGLKNGYSAVVDGGAGLSGGDVVLTFSEDIPAGNLSLMVEPALRLRPIVERKDGANWVEVDRQYVNANMLPGQELRASYEVYEEGTNRKVDLSAIFDNVEEKVTYGGSVYAPNAVLALKKGNNDIGISVSVKENGSTIYTMYATFGCNIADNPTYYRVDGSVTPVGNTGTAYRLDYQVFFDNKQVNKTQLSNYNWTITGQDADGTSITLPTPTVSANGNISVQVDLASFAYGQASFTLRVTDKDGFPREKTLTADHIPHEVFASISSTDALTMSQHGLLSNQDGFTFTASAATGALNLQNGAYGYRVTVGSKDVTSFCTVDAQGVHFVPTQESIGDLAVQAGDLPVKFTAFVKTLPQISASVSATVRITPTVFILSAEVRGGEIDPFDIDGANTKAYISVKRDGVYLSAEELQTIYDNGLLTVSVENRSFIEKILGSFRADYTVQTKNDIAYIVMTPTDRHFGLLSCFTSMFVFPGDRTVQASYQGVSASADFEIENVGAWAYIWRILVLFLILHVIMLIVGFKKINRFKTGRYVKLEVTLNSDKEIQSADFIKVNKINYSWTNFIFWKRLFIPIKYWTKGTQQREVELNRIFLEARKNQAPAVLIRNHPDYENAYTVEMEETNDFSAVMAKIKRGGDLTELNGLKLDFRLVRYLFTSNATEGSAKAKSAKGKKNKNKKRSYGYQGTLSGFKRPICLDQSGNIYTFIFFIQGR